MPPPAPGTWRKRGGKCVFRWTPTGKEDTFELVGGQLVGTASDGRRITAKRIGN